jgi:hypothetical protein
VLHASLLLGLFFDSENGGDMFLGLFSPKDRTFQTMSGLPSSELGVLLTTHLEKNYHITKYHKGLHVFRII